MSAYRITLRWALTLVAVALVLLALLSSGLRLAVSQIDLLRDELNEQLTRRLDATLQVEELRGSVHGLDPALALDDMRLASHIRPDPLPLLDIEHARVRLDVLASLRQGYPIFADARISEATLHLYQDESGRWQWPDPAEIPSELVPETDFEIETLDAAVGILLRQQAVVDNLRLALHGIDGEVALVAPRVLMTGDGRRAHLEGKLYVEGEQASAIETVLEVLPGQGGLEDFNAALQARADLSVLSRLGWLLTGQETARIEQVSGEANAWGRWRSGRLEDARAALDIDRLTLEGSDEPLVFNDIAARAQWLRGEGDTWQAWINALPMTDEQGEPSPLPERLQVEGDNQGWQLRSAGFDLGLLTAWWQRLPLSEPLQRTLDTLSPEGRVSGVAFGWRDGHWQARAALQGVAVSPWKGAPGGGPLDAWVQAQDGRGSVRFHGSPGMTLAFPEVFADPLELSEARGEVDWHFNEDGVSVGGEDLELTWRGAQVKGGFRFDAPHQAPPELELDLDMRDVNAIDTPLMAWLPVKVLDAELREWLASGIAGRVPRGSFYLRQTLDESDDEPSEQEESASDDDPFDGELRLSLQVEDGRLPYDPEWPALENVDGELTLHNESLQASVTHAETHGLVSEGGEVSLENERLSVQAPVSGSTQALLDFLAASPIEGSEAFADWRSEGRVDGRLDLAVPMSDTDALELAVAARVDAPRLTFAEIDLALGNLNGDLRYRHDEGEDFLTGSLGARAFDGPLLAEFDLGGRGITLEGRALARGLLQWAGMGGLENLLSGYFPYAATLDLDGEQPRLTIDSDLQGLGIQLPAPFGKRQGEDVALDIDMVPGQRLSVDLADRMRLRWRRLDRNADQGQGQVWLERWPSAPRWPSGPGWAFVWQTPRLDVGRWQTALAGLGPFEGATSAAPSESLPSLRNVQIDTQCLLLEQRCLGSLKAALQPQPQGWRFDLGGSLVEGRGEYRPGQPRPLSLSLTRLVLDSLIEDQAPQEPPDLASEIATAPDASPLPSELNLLPDGQITVDSLLRNGRRFGPLSARWDVSEQRVQVAPLSLRLGEVEVGGEVTWESAGPRASLTRSRIALSGGDIGTLFETLDQPVALRSEETEVRTQLAWPGAPWQFALERSRGNIETTLRDGRFLTLDSSSAKLIGLLNIDNLLRRLRLDFTDVTGRGTAFDRVQGGATLYDGRLETRGPVEIEGPSTQFSLDGSVNLIRRQLDLTLGVTVPISQNLPLAAVLIGAPYVGGALFLADKVFGGWIDKVTRIYYSVQGPWASPRITVERAE